MKRQFLQRSFALGIALWLGWTTVTLAQEREVRTFRIRSLTGEQFDSRRAGGSLVLSFFFTRCPPCIREMPALLKFMQKRGATERLLFVDPYVSELEIADAPDSERQIRRFVRQLGVPEERVYFDEIGTLAKKFARAGVFPQANRLGILLLFPTLVVIDAEHRVRLVLEGPPPDFLARIEEAL